MTKRTRTILFFICVILFALVSPAIVLYSQGYRIDLESKKITKTGGIFLKAEPKQAEIYLDGELAAKTNFITGSVYIENILPKNHKIEIKKEGFFSWEKNLQVEEGRVAEAKTIVLFQKNPNFATLTEGVEKFWFSPDGKKIIFKENIKTKNDWALKLYDLEKNIKSHLINGSAIYSKGIDLISLEWSQNSKELYLAAGLKEQEKNYLLRLDKVPTAVTERKIQNAPENILTYQKIDNDIYYLDDSGFVYKSDSSFSPGQKINEEAFPVRQETEYKLNVFPNYIFLQEGPTLYLFNRDSKSFEKFFEGIKGLKISPDSKKIAYFSDSEIWILFLEDRFEQPQRKAEEKMFLARFSEKIRDVFWVNGDYLIFNAGNNLKITETDNRDKTNIYEMGGFENPEIYFNATDNKLYILSDEKLYQSAILIP